MRQTSHHRPMPAIIAAAGRSRRMGEPKQLLPWADDTVIGVVVRQLAAAGAAPILCIVGHRAAEVTAALVGLPARVVVNPDYRTAEMLSSYQAGIRLLLAEQVDPWGALLCLGDQPHLAVETLAQIMVRAAATPEAMVIPSFRRRRGHPIYLPHALWQPLLQLGADQSLRTLINGAADRLVYVDVESDAVLRDMDTPEEYLALAAREQTPSDPAQPEAAAAPQGGGAGRRVE